MESIELHQKGDSKATSRNRFRPISPLVILIVIIFWILSLLLVGLLVGLIPRTSEIRKDNSTHILTTVGPPITTPNPNEPWHNKILPYSLVPSHYDLIFYPDLYGQNGTKFTGNATITAKTVKPTRYILLHIRNMNITSYQVNNDRTNRIVPIEKAFQFPKNEYWVMSAQDIIPTDTTLQLKLSFAGSLIGGLSGFYKTSFRSTKDNMTKYMATTKFEPSHARQAFPCFDEPHYKAYFTLQLIHKNTHIALANMPKNGSARAWKSRRADGDELLMTHFQNTNVQMSTYLVCFIVCESYDYIEATASKPLTRIYAPSHKIQHAHYAVTISAKIEAHFVKLFNFTSPLPKTDHIAIPDFQSGAMENWGLITYRETALLYDATVDSESNRRRVASVIAHELAHIWFGNIVTMSWWNEIWLNEGFASYFDTIGLGIVEPQWDNVGLEIVKSTRERAMRSDAMISTSPIVRKPTIVNNLRRVFNTISYSKGEALLMWINSLMGEDKFKASIQRYIHKKQYGNANTTDILRCFDEESRELNVSKMMRSWLYQQGYPTVNVAYEAASDTIVSTQKWFLYNSTTRSEAEPSPYNYSWWINMKYISSNNPSNSKTVHMTHNQSTIRFDSPVKLSNDPDSWILFNADSKGYYRVNYDQFLWKRIIRQLKTDHTKFTPLQRAILLNDVFAHSKAGILSTALALNVTRYLSKEEHLYPWRMYKRYTLLIQSHLQRSVSFGLWQSYVQSLVTNVYNNMDTLNTSYAPNDLLLGVITRLACENGHKKCLQDASKQFMVWINTGRKPRVEIRDKIFFYGLRENDSEENWKKLWNTYVSEVNHKEKRILIRGLTGTRQVWLQKKLLDYLLDRKYVRLQEFSAYLSYVVGTLSGNSAAWEWMNANWPRIAKSVGNNTSELRTIVSYCAPTLESRSQISSINNFFDYYPDAEKLGLRPRLIKSAENYLKWKEEKEQPILQWLQNNINNKNF